MRVFVAAFVLTACSHQATPLAGGADAAADIGSIETEDAATDIEAIPETVGPGCPVGAYFIRIERPGIVDEFRHLCAISRYSGSYDTPLGYRQTKGFSSGIQYIACATHDEPMTRKSVILLDDGEPGNHILLLSREDHWQMDNVGGPPLEIKWTRDEPVGGVIEGTFRGELSVSMLDGGRSDPVPVTGAFRLCHAPDVVVAE